MRIQLSDHFTTKRLLLFTMPSIAMMVFTSIYGMVDGLVSAVISFLRTIVFETGAILLLPAVIGKDGIWISIIVAEVSALLLTAVFVKAKGRKYGYMTGNI